PDGPRPRAAVLLLLPHLPGGLHRPGAGDPATPMARPLQPRGRNPLFVVGFGQGVGWWLAGTEEPLNLVFFLLATPVQFVAGWRFYHGTWDAFKNRSANMDVLIALGTTAAWAYSAVVTFLPFLGFRLP